MKSGFDTVEIWSQRGNEKEFARLANVTRLPYCDNRPNAVPTVAGQRDYYAYFLEKTRWPAPSAPPPPCWCKAWPTLRLPGRAPPTSTPRKADLLVPPFL